jgi:AcrR family transcriptional regulator
VTAMRKPARSKSIEKRQRIVDAAAKMLVVKGYAGFTLQDVANDVGMYAASIYYYFPSRDDLIREVLDASLAKFHDNIAEALDSLPPGSTPIDRVKSAIRAAVRINTALDDYTIAYTRIFDQAPEPLASEVRRRRKGIRDLWRDLLQDAQAAGELSATVDISMLRFIIVGATQWVSYWYDPNGARSPDEVADAFVDVLLNGAARPG